MCFEFRKNCLRTLLVILLIFIVLYILVVVLFGFHDLPPMMVSKNIEESKKNQVFIRECKIANLEVYDTSYQFPFEQAWEEKRWKREQNDKKKIVIVIDSLTSQIVFELKRKNDFDKEWAVQDNFDDSFLGTMGGMLYVSLSKYNDSTKLSFTIYKRDCEVNWKDATPLFKFELIRDD